MLTGRKVLITGGASGIGLACARALVQNGAQVAIMDICEEARLSEVARDIGPGAHGVRGDVTDPESVRVCVAEAANLMGGLDGLVNSAGATRNAYIYELSDEDFDWTVKLLLYGPMHTMREVSRYMIDTATTGSMVNISSMNSIVPYRTIGPYCAAKAALNMLTRVASLDLVRYGIRVNAVLPGFVDTPMTEDVNNDELNKVILQHVPMKRWGKPEEQAEVVAFLLSDRASSMTGALLMTDGGVSSMAYPDILSVIDGDSYYTDPLVRPEASGKRRASTSARNPEAGGGENRCKINRKGTI